MKKIGLVSGIGPASTVDYYIGLINLCRRERGQDVLHINAIYRYAEG